MRAEETSGIRSPNSPVRLRARFATYVPAPIFRVTNPSCASIASALRTVSRAVENRPAMTFSPGSVPSASYTPFWISEASAS